MEPGGSLEMIGMREMMKILAVRSRTTIYKLIKSGAIPAPCRIGTSRLAWRNSDITEWHRNLKPEFNFDKNGQGSLF